MKTRSFVFLSVLAFLLACKPNNNSPQREFGELNGEKIPIIRLDLVNDSASNVPLSTLFEDVEIISLETRPECLVGYCSYIMTDHSVLVAARNRLEPIRLYEFDLNGNFVREFGGIGKGPGEHQGYIAGRLTWHPDEKLIMATFQGSSDEEFLFNQEGKFIQAISLPWEMGGGVLRLSDNLYMTSGPCYGIPKFKRDSFQLALFRSNGEWVNGFPRRSYPPENKTGYTSGGRTSFWRYKNVWRIYSPGYDTIYQISEKALSPVAILNFGSNHYRYNQFVDPKTEVGRFSIEVLRETDRYIYIKKKHLSKLQAWEWQPGQWGSSSFLNYSLLLYNKLDGLGYNLRFEDDILGILPVETIQMYQSWDDLGNVCRIAQAVDVLEWIAEAKMNNKLPNETRDRILELENSIDDNSNPILFIYKERNEKKYKSRLETR